MTEHQDPHYPVMLNEVLENLAPKAGEVHVDGTLGAGGYTRAILSAAPCEVVSVDRDQLAIDMAQKWQSDYEGRSRIIKGCFGDVEALLKENAIGQVDGFVLDLGVSSMQLDQGERGFSFRFDGPLDMRMSQGNDDIPTAADIVNTTKQDDLANLIYKYGEERASRRVANAICRARSEEKITTTGRLAEIVRSAVPHSKKDKIDPATRTFQALRIAVNDELGELERALEASLSILKPGGRLVMVTFHSLEDRIVKSFMREKSGNLPAPSRHVPMTAEEKAEPLLKLVSKKAIEPTEKECRENPRSRSAKLRTAIRTEAGGVNAL